VLPEFLERYPDVHIDFVYSGHLFDTCDVGADVMLRMFVTDHEADGVIAQPIGHTQLVCVASPAYLEEHGTPRTPHDLTLHRCLMFIDTLSGRRWEWRFHRGEESIVLDFPDAIGFAHRAARIAAAVRGLGILYEEQCYVASQLATGELRLVLEDWAWESPRSYVVYGPKRLDNDKVQAFVDFVLEKYPPDRPIASF
jgi:LysR family transcriptional regulator, regulator for bpeEF and oprC